MPELVERIRAAAFDLDGTLVDSAADLAAAVNAMLEALGLATLPQRDIESLIGDGVERLITGALAESAGCAPSLATLAAAAELFRQSYADGLFERSRVYPGVDEALRSLECLGIKLCCITNKRSEFTLPLLAAAGLANRFALVLCADRVEQRKPAPELLIAACKHFGVPPHELVYVGDSRVDIAAARAAHCPVAVVDYGYSRGVSLADDDPDWVIGSVAELLALPAIRRSADAEV